MDYRWVQTGTLKTDSCIRALSWNLEGTRLLTAGDHVQLWHLNSQPLEEDSAKANVTFTVGGGENTDGTDSGDFADDNEKSQGFSFFYKF